MSLLDKTITFKSDDLIQAIRDALPIKEIPTSPWIVIPGTAGLDHAARIGTILRVEAYPNDPGSACKAYVFLADGTRLFSRATAAEIVKLIETAQPKPVS